MAGIRIRHDDPGRDDPAIGQPDARRAALADEDLVSLGVEHQAHALAFDHLRHCPRDRRDAVQLNRHSVDQAGEPFGG